MGTGPALVLVHSPLVGPTSWEPVAETLRGRGHRVVVPDLLPALRDSGPYYPRIARTVATGIDAHGADTVEEVALVAHSGAGALVPAIAAAAQSTVTVPVSVFVDALLPHPGRSWFDTVPPELGSQLLDRATDGFLPPWPEWFPPGAVAGLLPEAEMRSRFLAEVPRLPVDYTTEVPPDCADPDPDRCAYLQLSEAYTAEANQVAAAGWAVRHHDAHHLAILTDPESVASAIVELVGERVRRLG
ncbi:hypothetical protein RIF23_01450 [Lipingzhangella sp. LS1_29]|uniref:Alpha/beta hydrolase family protein n=1 Tax=Lipingzhangella rawalii TaxID=2055835 RepID=A0ABU2H0X2_9ACTN|nr:hypothetical protein [Lipingzhangella rawalii]MDS1268953.1 hypothetical protein [Lipingzhangella rawalii]